MNGDRCDYCGREIDAWYEVRVSYGKKVNPIQIGKKLRACSTCLPLLRIVKEEPAIDWAKYKVSGSGLDTVYEFPVADPYSQPAHPAEEAE